MLDKNAQATLLAAHPSATVGFKPSATPENTLRRFEGKVVAFNVWPEIINPDGTVKAGNASLLIDIYRVEVPDLESGGQKMVALAAHKLVTMRCSLQMAEELKEKGLGKGSQAFFYFNEILNHDTSINERTGKPVDKMLAAQDGKPEKPVHRVSGLQLRKTEVKSKAQGMSLTELIGDGIKKAANAIGLSQAAAPTTEEAIGADAAAQGDLAEETTPEGITA